MYRNENEQIEGFYVYTGKIIFNFYPKNYIYKILLFYS